MNDEEYLDPELLVEPHLPLEKRLEGKQFDLKTRPMEWQKPSRCSNRYTEMLLLVTFIVNVAKYLTNLE